MLVYNDGPRLYTAGKYDAGSTEPTLRLLRGFVRDTMRWLHWYLVLLLLSGHFLSCVHFFLFGRRNKARLSRPIYLPKKFRCLYLPALVRWTALITWSIPAKRQLATLITDSAGEQKKEKGGSCRHKTDRDKMKLFNRRNERWQVWSLKSLRQRHQLRYILIVKLNKYAFCQPITFFFFFYMERNLVWLPIGGVNTEVREVWKWISLFFELSPFEFL